MSMKGSQQQPFKLINSLLQDLEFERQTARSLLLSLQLEDWLRPTPAPGWSVREQVIHLAHFDFMAGLAFSDPQGFIGAMRAIQYLDSYVDSIGPANLSRTPHDILCWWNDQAQLLAQSSRDFVHSSDQESPKVPWFGPSMSPASMITARIMETWAHTQDIFDTFGETRGPSPSLPHVARIGVLALPNSFRANQRRVPEVPVYVNLTLPSGEVLSFGDDSADNTVAGTVEDFCLVVTRRRHVADTNLEATGKVAREWMLIAQAFAGQPGVGRMPGQFA